MKQKYKSGAFRAMHEVAVAEFKIGAISKKEMDEWDEMCFVAETPPVYYAAHETAARHREPISAQPMRH
jgi:DNA-binding transcriptional regulator YiaG